MANVCFKTYGYISMTQAVYFLSDFKLGHYMKIPPRAMFNAQVTSFEILYVTWYFVQLVGLNLVSIWNSSLDYRLAWVGDQIKGSIVTDRLYPFTLMFHSPGVSELAAQLLFHNSLYGAREISVLTMQILLFMCSYWERWLRRLWISSRHGGYWQPSQTSATQICFLPTARGHALVIPFSLTHQWSGVS